MGYEGSINAPEQRFTEAFAALPDRDALRLLKTLAERFSGLSYGYDRVDAGIDLIAVDLAEQEDWRGNDLAHRYLENPTRFGPSFGHVMVAPIADPAFYGKQFGG